MQFNFQRRICSRGAGSAQVKGSTRYWWIALVCEVYAFARTPRSSSDSKAKWFDCAKVNHQRLLNCRRAPISRERPIGNAVAPSVGTVD